MRITLRICMLAIFVCGALFAFPQKSMPAFEQKYREAEVLENNALYDIARIYYAESYQIAHSTRQHRNILKKIKGKVQKMDCYAMFYHLVNQANMLEFTQDFESSEKYFRDAIEYARDENLTIPGIDSLRNRLNVVHRTFQLCEKLKSVNFHNENGNFSDAKVLFNEMTTVSSELHNDWKKYSFQDGFIRKFDSLSNFLAFNRNISKKYRDVFSNEFAVIDKHLLDLIDRAACRHDQAFESDVAFRFSIDTNGVESRYVSCSHNSKAFSDSLVAALDVIKLQQPYSYGFSLPTEDAISHHIASYKKNVMLNKTKNGYFYDDSEFEKHFRNMVMQEMQYAPDGKYFFIFHKNTIDSRTTIHADLVSGKGSKARKWAKNNIISF